MTEGMDVVVSRINAKQATDWDYLRLGVDLGLDCLFGGNEVAMNEWLSKSRPIFDGKSGYDLLATGNVSDAKRVIYFLDEARGLR